VLNVYEIDHRSAYLAELYTEQEELLSRVGIDEFSRGASELMGEYLKVVWAKFSTLSWTALIDCEVSACEAYNYFKSWKLGLLTEACSGPILL
jgi:hypothetical protein